MDFMGGVCYNDYVFCRIPVESAGCSHRFTENGFEKALGHICPSKPYVSLFIEGMERNI